MVHIPDQTGLDLCEDPQESRLDRLEALLACVEDLESIDRSIDLLTERFQRKKAPAKASRGAAARTSPSWIKKESSRYPGRFYYMNTETGETSWKHPTKLQAAAQALPVDQKNKRPLGKGTPPMLERVPLSSCSTDIGSSDSE
eukprot:TRINITY_DN94639_c0_g1_i1.p3 TRINITY_DN94639_c0_g1~~TRINITY_DN94639_c0_g1_i1.p3  ORF type:complete len:143 (-),score=37.54 TRINITY_DN94639_c0_g1_i1:147-575(-)